MSMMNTGDILETIEMFTQDNLDVRTVTMGISLLDCIDPDPRKACEKIYNKITTRAARLVPAVEHISAEYGIPIINKRISVTPIAMNPLHAPSRSGPPAPVLAADAAPDPPSTAAITAAPSTAPPTAHGSLVRVMWPACTTGRAEG